MISSAECHAKVKDMERRALSGPDSIRAEWTAMAAHWQGLEDSALRTEGRLLATRHKTL